MYQDFPYLIITWGGYSCPKHFFQKLCSLEVTGVNSDQYWQDQLLIFSQELLRGPETIIVCYPALMLILMKNLIFGKKNAKFCLSLYGIFYSPYQILNIAVVRIWKSFLVYEIQQTRGYYEEKHDCFSTFIQIKN